MARPATMRDRVRAAARSQSGTFSYDDLGDGLGLQDRAELAKMKRAVRNLLEGGELVRVRPGCFNWQGKKPGAPSLQEVMWRVLRARKVVSIPDIEELSGAKRAYALEFIYGLKKQGVVQEIKVGPDELRKFRLVYDPGPEPPRNGAKTEYLRRRREKIKKALTALDAVFVAVAEARLAVSGLEE